MKQKFLQLVLSPFIIAGFISVATIYFARDYFNKYQAVLDTTDHIGIGSVVYYEDLDGDGTSEKIVAQEKQAPKFMNASYLLYKSNGDFVDQFNLDRPFCNDHRQIWFKDLNRDGTKELYIPTKSNDSAFLEVQEHNANGMLKRKSIFIDVMTAYNKEYEFKIFTTRPFTSMMSLDTDLYFTITNGYSGNPRNVYKYEYESNEILKSPHLTNSGHISEIIDLDNDGKNEILIGTNAPGNNIDSIYTKRSDYSTWITVLDDDLKFLFQPIEIKHIGSTSLKGIKVDGGMKLICFFNSKQKNEFPSRLIRLSSTGKIEREEAITFDIYRSNFSIIDNRLIARYNFKEGRIVLFDINFELAKDLAIEPNITLLNYYDIDQDGEKEWIGFHSGNEKISIYRDDFAHKVTFVTNWSSGRNFRSIGLREFNSKNDQLYLQKGSSVAFFDYGKNPNYMYKYPAYIALYASVLGILLLVAKGQKNVETRKRAIEKEIAELQLKTIKNQVDPHFVFNAINIISEMTLMDNKLEADKFITRFSGFMRDTLKHSDKISTTLEEEIEYTENFIKLQQIRFSHGFDYKIVIDASVNRETRIPKHVLFTYVENAIKHGLPRTKNGLLHIKATQNADHLLLTIEDNGGGIQQGLKNKSYSTGSGLKIMDQIFDLYTKLNKRKIKHELIELFDAQKIKTGIRVEIKIANPK